MNHRDPEHAETGYLSHPEGYLFRGREKPQGQRPVWDVESVGAIPAAFRIYFRGRPPWNEALAWPFLFLGTFDHRWRANCAAWIFFLVFSFWS